MSACHNDREKSWAIKINEHTPSVYSSLTHCSFDLTKNKFDCYKVKDFMNKFCKDLKEKAKKKINYDKNKWYHTLMKKISLIKTKKYVIDAKKGISIDDDNKKYHNVRDHCHYTGKYRGAAHSVCSLRYKTPKTFPIVFHNGSTYDYNFIIKEPAKEFEG